VLALVKAFHDVAPFSWFVGAALGAGLYMILNRAPRTAPAAMPAKVA
jgi:NCS1 family nucleobase:cation symporter-1